MMTCRELIDFIAEYLTDELPQAEREAFEQHLSDCKDCRAYLDSYSRTLQLEKSAFDDDPHSTIAQMPSELVSAILAARRSREGDASNAE